MSAYPDALRVAAAEYGVRNGRDRAAFQFGVPAITIAGWMARYSQRIEEMYSKKFDKELTKWILKSLENGYRPTLEQIGVKGLEIAPRVGKSLYFPTGKWSRKFLKRVHLYGKWRNYLRKKTKVQNAPAEHQKSVLQFRGIDLGILKRALEYAELHGNRVAANKYDIPERIFYEYIMKSSEILT